ncbi:MULTISPECIES: outer membrane lipoprotein carrier protein LolA [Halobacterium]|uniref:LolA family protein n=1 Tax=Halobacterium TaxID=2239 RepID=UPI00073E5882|nr:MULTISPECIES: outer membrane lipoprotein carrier protein LolA [Halobacterium]MCG1002294.1 outer membrane lipoprotein carrier protein LolA [Halobacterium noricense]
MNSDGRTTDRGSVATVVVGAAVVAVVVAGALWMVTAPEAASRPIGMDASEQYAGIDGVTATETIVVERGNRTSRTVADVALRPGTDERRRTVVDGSVPYEVTVSNGSTMWLYDGDADHAKRVPLSETPDRGVARADRIERLFTALNVTEQSASTSASSPKLAPLPLVPSASSGPNDTDEASLGVQYDGTTTVGDREAYVLRIAPQSEGATYEQTLLVDTQRFFVLEQHTEWVEDGSSVSVTTTYTNVSFDPGLDDATFRFDPPANTTVERVNTPKTTTYEDAAALREATNVSVPTPELPASFRPTYTSETTGEVHGVGLRYVNETARITVSKYNRTFPADGDRTVSVGDHDAAVTYGATTSVSWNCETYRYTVRGQGASTSVLVEVARSVACE